MDLTFGKEELAFQKEVRDWLKDNLTPEIVGELKVGRNAYMPKERLVDWQKRLAKKGVIRAQRYSQRPPRLEYELTEKGQDLRPIMRAMVEWGVQHAGGRTPPPVTPTQ